MKLMVFDVGGTEIKYSVMDDALQVSASGAVPTPYKDLPDFIETLAGLYEPHKHEVEGIAMSLPGFIDQQNGVVRGGGALQYNWGQPVGRLLAERCGCTVVLENDGKAAAMAELAGGSLKGCCNASVFIIGTGVGGGLIVDGKVVRGLHCTAGEFSFVNMDASNWQTFDSAMANRCSTSSLLGLYRATAGLPEDAPLDGRKFFALVNAGDATAKQVLEQFSMAVATQVYNLGVLLDVEKVAIGGGISRQPVLIEEIRKAYHRIMDEGGMSWVTGALPRVEVVSCAYHNEANQIGAFYAYRDAMAGKGR